MTQAIVFDLDGTLIDTIGDIAASVNEALAARGYATLPAEEYRPLVGWGLRSLVKSLLPPDDAEEAELVEAVTEEAIAAYARNPVVHTRPYEGITEMLEACAARGIRTAILSNKATGLVTVIVDILFPHHHFDQVRGLDARFKAKPDPGQCLDVIAALGARAEDTVFIGDSAIDIRTGKAAGLRVIACSWGFRPLAELDAEKPDSIVHSPGEILAKL